MLLTIVLYLILNMCIGVVCMALVDKFHPELARRYMTTPVVSSLAISLWFITWPISYMRWFFRERKLNRHTEIHYDPRRVR